MSTISITETRKVDLPGCLNLDCGGKLISNGVLVVSAFPGVHMSEAFTAAARLAGDSRLDVVLEFNGTRVVVIDGWDAEQVGEAWDSIRNSAIRMENRA